MTQNLLMITIDDLKDWSALKGLYQGGVPTPHLDALMGRGTQFTQAFAQTPICSPSRASALTGLYPASEHELDISDIPWYETINLSTTIPAYLKNQGFETVTAGKIFHTIEYPTDVSNVLWDDNEETAGGVTKSQLVALNGSPTRDNIGKPYTGTQPLSDEAVTTWASDYLADVGNAQRFFMAVGLNATHDRWDAPAAYFDKFSLDKIILPEAPVNDLNDVPQYVIDEIGMGPFNSFRTEAQAKKAIQAYLASVSFLDDQIGRLMAALDSTGHADDTAVILWSDHGFQHGEKNNWNKFTLWDASARAPLIIVDPNAGTPGSVAEQPVGFVNIAPTAYDLLGVAPPPWLEAPSLVPLIENSNASWDDPVFTSVYGSYSIRTADWRYTLYEDQSEELYNIANDPREYNNLASSPANAAIKAALKAELLDFLDEQGVILGTSGNDNLQGDSGTNEFFPGTGTDTMTGGAGDDLYQVDSPDDKIIELAGGGDDTAIVLRTDYVLPDNVENLKTRAWRQFVPMKLTGNESDNLIAGANAADKIYGLGGNDEIFADAGNDIADGGAGNDILHGSDGNDILYGGSGNDVYWGDGGADTHVFAAGDGQDIIRGFTNGVDKLSFTGFGAAYDTAQEIIAAATQTGADTVITLANPSGGTTKVTIAKFTKSNLDASDIVTVPVGTPTYDLRFSAAADRSGSLDLQGAIMQGNAFIFLQGSTTNVTKVTFTLDGQQSRIETTAPWDFRGGTLAIANPFDSKTLSEGAHTIGATILFGDNTTAVASDTFTVDNIPSSTPTYDLRFSTVATRAGDQDLQGAALAGNAFVFLKGSATGVSKVTFSLDGQQVFIENTAPYDFKGGTASAANPFNTTTLSEGQHTIRAQVLGTNGVTTTVSDTFSIDNVPDGPAEYDLLYSNTANRANPLDLDGAVLSGDKFVFLAGDPTGVSKVTFKLDGVLTVVELGAPWDFKGGTAAQPKPFDTDPLVDGPHSISATVLFTDGDTLTITDNFLVA